MLRRYGRWGFVAAAIIWALIILDLNFLQRSGGSSHDPDAGSLTPPKPEEPLQAQETIYHGFAPMTEEPESSTLNGQAKMTRTGEQEVGTTGPAHTTLLGQASALQETSDTTEVQQSKETTKVVVVGRMRNEDTDWIADEMTDWQNAIYYIGLSADEESPSGLKTKMNKAKEVTPYLTYLVEHYPDFPDVMAFIHPHRSGLPNAWHNDAPDYSAVHMLNALRLDTVLERGYVNLRCNNEIGCPDEIQPWRSPRDDTKTAELAYPYVYAHFFNTSFAEMREQIPVVATQCCAQFAVSREQVLKRPKGEYERYLRFVEETHYDDRTTGTVLEYMWHIIFGREAVQCENMFECWCNVYGRCKQGGGGGRFDGGPLP